MIAGVYVDERTVRYRLILRYTYIAAPLLPSPRHCVLPAYLRIAMLGIGGLVASPTIDLSTPTKSRPPSRLPSSSGAIPTIPSKTDATSPAITRTTVSLEYASLRHTGHCPLGMYVIPSPADLLVWDAVFFVHQGPSPLPLHPCAAAHC